MRPTLHRFLLLTVNLLVGLNAIVAGAFFIADPSGRLIGMPLDVLRYAPFSTFLVPGLVLAFVVGGSAMYAALRSWQRRGGVPSLVAGTLLFGWILIQMVMLRDINGLQLFCLGCGGAQLGLGLSAPVAKGGRELARRFLAHPRIALIGLSSNPDDFSHAIRKELEAKGYEVVGVGKGTTLASVPNPPKAALLMVPAAASLQVVRDCVAAGVEAIWFHRGAGAGAASPEAVAAARAAHMLVVTDACPLMYVGDGLHGTHRWVHEHGAASTG